MADFIDNTLVVVGTRDEVERFLQENTEPMADKLPEETLKVINEELTQRKKKVDPLRGSEELADRVKVDRVDRAEKNIERLYEETFFSFLNAVHPVSDEEWVKYIFGDGEDDPTFMYRWNVQHWGVKWDARPQGYEIEREGDDEELFMSIHFETPYVPPMKYFDQLGKIYDHLNLTVTWNEPRYGGDDNGQTIDYQDGEKILIDEWGEV